MRRARPVDERLWPRVVEDARGCWIFQGAPSPNGYGMIWTDGGKRLVHRVAYELIVGVIPAGLHIDHLCRVRMCVNPAHLEPVTCRENLHRSPIAPAALNALKKECPRGHRLTRLGSGRRYCRVCNRDAMRARRAA
jgi:hypothetical protein